jgi:hypothetical protein
VGPPTWENYWTIDVPNVAEPGTKTFYLGLGYAAGEAPTTALYATLNAAGTVTALTPQPETLPEFEPIWLYEWTITPQPGSETVNLPFRFVGWQNNLETVEVGSTCPDGGSTAAALGLAVLGLALWRRRTTS